MTSDTPLPWPVRGQSNPGDDPVAAAAMAAMTEALRAMLALPGLADLLSTRTLPAAFFARWAEALAAYDRYVAHLLAVDGRPVTCQAGCATCCRHELARGVTGVELLAIYRYVRPWPDIGARYDAAGENAVAFQRLLHAEIQKTGAPLVVEDPRVYQAHLAYNRLQRPCAFLDDAAGLCSIYPVRPLVCRWFHNRSPAAWCAPDHPDYLARDAVGVDPDREVNDLLAELDRRLGLRLVNYLAGAFVQIGGDVFGGAPVREV